MPPALYTGIRHTSKLCRLVPAQNLKTSWEIWCIYFGLVQHHFGVKINKFFILGKFVETNRTQHIFKWVSHGCTWNNLPGNVKVILEISLENDIRKLTDISSIFKEPHGISYQKKNPTSNFPFDFKAKHFRFFNQIIFKCK